MPNKEGKSCKEAQFKNLNPKKFKTAKSKFKAKIAKPKILEIKANITKLKMNSHQAKERMKRKQKAK